MVLPVGLASNTLSSFGTGHHDWHNHLNAFWNHYAVDPQTAEGISAADAQIIPHKLKIYEGSDASPITDGFSAALVISRVLNTNDITDSNAAIFAYSKNRGLTQPVAVKGTTLNTGNSDSCAAYFTAVVSGIKGGAYGYFSIAQGGGDYTCLISNGNPAIITVVGHNLKYDDEVMFTGGSLPTGILDQGRYWVFNDIDADRFHLLDLPSIILPTTATHVINSIGTGVTLIIQTSAPHGLSTNDVLFITSSNSTPSINGAYPITVTDATHFTISFPSNVTGAGNLAYWQKYIATSSAGSGTHYITGGKVFAFNPYNINATHFDFNKDNPGLIMTSYLPQTNSSFGKKAGSVMHILGPNFAEGIIVEAAISDYLIYDRGIETNPLAWVGSYQTIWDSSAATVSGSHIKLGNNFAFGFSLGQPLFSFSSGMAYIPNGGPPQEHAFYTGGNLIFGFHSSAIIFTGLPAANPGAGTKQFWYDPADGNRVKYSP